jgi:hypothetical protein
VGGTAGEAVVGSGNETGRAVVALHLLESDEQRKDLRLGLE